MSSQSAKQMFRKEALEQLSSPDELDQLLQVVTRKSWIPILTLAAGLLAAVVWSIVGRIPVSAEGVGLLVYPERVRSFQAPASGQIVSLTIKVGEDVEKHDVIGRINQAELQQRFEHEQVRLTAVKASDDALLQLHRQRTEQEKQSIERSRRRLKERIDSTSQMAAGRKAKNDKYFAQQAESLSQLDEMMQDLGRNVAERCETTKALFEAGSGSNKEMSEAQRERISHDVQFADHGLRVHEIELKKIEAESEHIRQTNLVADLQADLEELDVLTSKIDLLQLETISDSNLRIQEIQRNIDRYKKQLDTKGAIVSEYSGRVLEVTGAVGQFVTAGQRLGSIEDKNTEADLVAVVYYDESYGKRIEPEMDALVSPTTVQRARFGSIVGSVVKVSPYPVTTDAVANVVGNMEVAQRLTAGGNKIEVICEIERDPKSHSGFKWTSGRGPDESITEITTGTPVTVHTTIEDRRPISYVIPLARRWSGS